jgi:outer membrane protein TolC
MSLTPVVPLLVAGGLAIAGPVGSEPQPPAAGTEDTVLTGLVEEALARNADLLAGAAAVRAAKQRPAQASSLADPVLGVGYTNEGWSFSLGTMPDTNLAFVVSQDLPFPGKRRLRREIASREADQVEQQLARARLTVVAAVRRAYLGLLQARALLDLAREREGLWRQIEGVARARYAVGQGNQQDVLRTQVERTRVGQAVAEQEAEAAIRLAEINRLLGRAAPSPLTTSAVPEAVAATAPLASEIERLRAISPELSAARTAIDRARLVVDLARKEYHPDFGVLGGYMNRGGLDPMWQAGVTVNLPLRRTRRASALAEAEAALAAARSRLESVERQLRLRTQERLAQLEAARKIGTLYGEGIVPQDRMSVEAAIASYEAGRVPFITVLESLTTLYGDRSTLVRVLADQSRIKASLDEASLETTSDLPAMAPAAMASGPAGGALSTGGTAAGAMGSMSR